jgi:threonine aldolase
MTIFCQSLVSRRSAAAEAPTLDPRATESDGQTVAMALPESLPEPPRRRFASDNNAGAHPAVLEAVIAANEGHQLAYGDDPHTAETSDRMNDLFGRPVETFLVWGGTGANVMALATLLSPGGAVMCTDCSHINVDETGAPERMLGAKLIDVAARDGKIVPDQIDEYAHFLGVQHHVQPSVLSITQSTEMGSLYTPEEIAALCDTAHRLGMRIHLDGARIANATAALGGTVKDLRSFTIDAGVDALSFGATKNGLLYGEAVVYLDTSLARYAPYVRKQVTQLPSKMRYVAAQFNALLHDDLWLANAAHANRMATLLHDQVSNIPGVELDAPPVVNSLYPVLPADRIAELQRWSYFYDWDVHRHQVRWMTSWDTTDDDVAAFAAGVRHILTS